MAKQVFTMIIPTENPRFKIIEMGNWTGKVFIVPRASLKDLKEREEANNPGLYFLFGENEENGKQSLYIGETENFSNRLTTHDQTKDFWNFAVIFIGGVDKAKVKYLEYLAKKEAEIAMRFNLQNSASPKKPHLSEPDEITVLEYFDKIKFILSVLGYPVFEKIDESISDTKIYYLKADGADARAQLLNDGSLNVLKGSLARIRETEAFFGWSKVAREKFLKEGILIKSDNNISFIFTKDVLFTSPTAAAATTTGRPINGWTAWKDEKGNTLDENLRK